MIANLLLLILGVLLAGGGFLFFKEGLYALGFLIGLSAGVVSLQSEATTGQWGLVVLVAAPIIGIALAVSFRYLIVAIPGAVGGAAVAIVLTDLSLSEPSNLVDPTVLAAAIVGIVAAWFIETAIMIAVSASWGATLVSLSLGGALFEPGTTIRTSVLELISVTYWFVFGLGIVVQVAIWYYLRTTLDDDEEFREVLLESAGQQYESYRS
ncbi:hypothetical protein [Natrinema halophilum]|uniref:DUF4203 domain-containing protein n=1 Tax=Natrinema halophilum TaxID=1699371 RepID=A0A7D5H928_9EURY|nr:hypothetical protein [Natrinema halophilum]QLG49975.1 hypothetical protein HYG82_14485 [Natrinema halophilum]